MASFFDGVFDDFITNYTSLCLCKLPEEPGRGEVVAVCGNLNKRGSFPS